MLNVRLLGQFEVRRDGTLISIPARAAQSLLAYLLLTAGARHRREKLAGLLWPDTAEEKARSNLRHELWRLRKVIETKTLAKRAVRYFLVDDISIGFDPASDYSLDVARVLQPQVGEESADTLIGILSLYRGELLPGFYDDWAVLEREHAQAAFEQKMARLLELLVQKRRWQDTLEWGERWIALGQRPEPAYRALMAAHSALGNQSQVASVYERCKQAMRNDLGVEPSEQTQALFERLAQGEPPSVAVPARARTTRASTRGAPTSAEHVSAPSFTPLRCAGHLPVPLTSFIGREREIDELKHSLSTKRLLTLTGAGGVGKTRLAIQLAGDLSSEYKDGAGWVDLVPLTDPALVPQAVAKALGVLEIPNVPLIETLAETLCSKQILLVFDNCEHLVAACAQLANTLVSSCASLKILTTSREALGIAGETVWRVPSLSFPTAERPPSINELGQYESVRLFIDRAHAANSDFVATEQNAAAITQICQRLDGIPLAIELAAGRVKTLSLQQISARLDNRFNLLTQGSRTALPRHQTLRATIDWSYEQLSDLESTLFRRLAVFAGGWTLEAVEFVCAGQGLEQAQVFEVLVRLVDKSLVVAEQRGEAVRYRVLETIRQYAAEKLLEAGQSDATHRRHLDFFLKLAEDSAPGLYRAEQSIVLDRLELEIDNLRAAVDWALENDHVIDALRLVSAIPRFWFVRAHHNEGLERLGKILDLPDAKRQSAARLKALNAYFFMHWPLGRLSEFQPLIEEAVALGIRFGDRPNTAAALRWLGISNTYRGDYSLARSQLGQSLEIYRELEDTTYLAWGLVYLAEVELLQGESERAQAFYEQAVPILKETRDYPLLAIPLRRLGQLAVSRGDLRKAEALIKESLKANWSVHDYRGTASSLAAYGACCIALDQIERATKLLAAVGAVLDLIRTSMLQFDQQQYGRNVATCRTLTDSASFEAWWAIGAGLPLDQGVALALEGETII